MTKTTKRKKKKSKPRQFNNLVEQREDGAQHNQKVTAKASERR